MIHGKWHAEGSAAQQNASLNVKDGLYELHIKEGRCYRGKIADLQISDRLGNVERNITLDDGSIFASPHNDTIDRLLQKPSSISGFIHRIESNMKWVVTGVFVTALFTFGFFKWGVPWASEKIAHALPHKTNELIALNTLKFFDKYLLQESKLKEARRTKIRSHFFASLVPLGSNSKSIKYKLHFRNWPGIPNALALPSGDIVLTDKFVELCKNQDEMDSVILHEIGHVERRHSLETLIESTFITVSIMLIVGDINFLGDMGVGLGSLLVSTAYSRDHESEADDFAFKKMLKAKIDPVSFSNIMNRMTQHVEGRLKERKKKAGENKVAQAGKKKETKANEKSYWDYLSSHPVTSKRVHLANQYSACFKKGLTTCQISPAQ